MRLTFDELDDLANGEQCKCSLPISESMCYVCLTVGLMHHEFSLTPREYQPRACTYTRTRLAQCA